MSEPNRVELAEWLVRTSHNLLLGPFTKDTLCELVRERKLTALDEVCRGNHYWFYLHEDAEVRSQLGVNLRVHNPRRSDAPGDDEESTQTDTATNDDEGDTDKVNAPGMVGEDFVRIRRAKTVPVEPLGPRPQVMRPIEGTELWRGVVWALVILIAVLLYNVFRLLGAVGRPPG